MVRTIAVVSFSFLLIGCGGGGGGGGGGDDADAGGGGGGDEVDAGGGGDDECDDAGDCADDEICNASGECEAGVACEAHGDCGVGGHCVDGTCEQNETGGTCDDDVNCPTADDCIEGFCGCEGAAFAAEPVTPNMMIVLDKSGSMDQDLDGDCMMRNPESGPDPCTYPPYDGNDYQNANWDAPSKWTVADDAMTGILVSHGDRVRFGLVTFASDENCGDGDVRVDIGDDTETEIQTTIDATSPIGATPIGDTLADLVGRASLQDVDHPNFVVLVTDGQETCDGDPEQAAMDLYAQALPVRTYVVGFGGGVDEAELDAVAVAGHTDRPSPAETKYYQANNAQELADALDLILGDALSCSYDLDQTPEDPDLLFVYADDNAVDRDTNQTEGWDYDGATNSVTFYGQVCADLQDGTITDVNIVYGCPAGGVD